MSDLRKAAEAVLEAWDWDWSEPRNEALKERMEALRQALAQPEQRADKEKLAQWMIQKDYATGHGDTVEDLLAELDQQLFENWNKSAMKVAAHEREACAEICDKEQEFVASGGPYVFSARRCATNIRARGDK